MQKTVPVVVYTDGQRRVIGEAIVELDDYPDLQINILSAEINLNNAGLSEPVRGYSLARESSRMS